MDSTHGTNQYGYLLTTVMEIRNRLTHLQPKDFMSDDDSAFWNAWQRVFGDVKYNTCYAVGMYHGAGIGILVLK
ncbi:hypothetical protein TNCV_1801671 [Trichonephila clavipes]|nr:hypothetical protein TNCV_1801671 [Trichonephila clavipes]